RGVPKFDRIVCASGRHRATVGTEGDCDNHRGVAGQSAKLLASSHIPKFDRFVRTPRGNGVPIKTKGNSEDRRTVADQRPQLESCGYVPKLDCVIVAS